MIATLLEKMIARIEEVGWIGGPSADLDDGPKCLINTCFNVEGGKLPALRNAVYDSVAKFLKLDNHLHLMRWNDAKGRTKEDVLQALRGTLEMVTVKYVEDSKA